MTLVGVIAHLRDTDHGRPPPFGDGVHSQSPNDSVGGDTRLNDLTQHEPPVLCPVAPVEQRHTPALRNDLEPPQGILRRGNQARTAGQRWTDQLTRWPLAAWERQRVPGNVRWMEVIWLAPNSKVFPK